MDKVLAFKLGIILFAGYYVVRISITLLILAVNALKGPWKLQKNPELPLIFFKPL